MLTLILLFDGLLSFVGPVEYLILCYLYHTSSYQNQGLCPLGNTVTRHQ